MKICICVSGQIRDNTEEPFYKLQQLIEKLKTEGHEITLIFSIWEEISRKLEGVINIKQLKKIFEPDLVGLISPNWYGKKLWKQLPKTLENVKKGEAKDAKEWVMRYFPDAIIDCENGNLLDLNFDYMTTTDNNSIKMLYKIWKANEIKRKIERDADGKFDYVIRIRPDYGIRTLNLNIEKNTVYIPSVLDNFTNLEDTFAAGSSEAIDYYCQLFAKSILPSAFKWRGIHAMLADHFNKQPFKEPQYQIKNAQKNGFLFQHMLQNSNKLDIEDIKADLNNDFYQALFAIVQLRRSGTSKANQQALKQMQDLENLCKNEDEQLFYFMLLQQIHISLGHYCAALKAVLLADFQFLSLNPKAIRWDHRYGYLLNQIGALLSELDICYDAQLVDHLLTISEDNFIDKLFQNANNELIKTNLHLLAETKKGQEILAQNEFKFA